MAATRSLSRVVLPVPGGPLIPRIPAPSPSCSRMKLMASCCACTSPRCSSAGQQPVGCLWGRRWSTMALSSSALPMVWRVMLAFGSRYCDRALLVLPVATASATWIRSSSRKLLRGRSLWRGWGRVIDSPVAVPPPLDVSATTWAEGLDVGAAFAGMTPTAVSLIVSCCCPLTSTGRLQERSTAFSGLDNTVCSPHCWMTNVVSSSRACRLTDPVRRASACCLMEVWSWLKSFDQSLPLVSRPRNQASLDRVKLPGTSWPSWVNSAAYSAEYSRSAGSR